MTKQSRIGILNLYISLIVSCWAIWENIWKEVLQNVNLLDKIFSKPTEVLYAPVPGKVLPLSQVPDTAIANGLLGNGIAIEPVQGRICAPCDATVDMVFETGHAVSLIADFGAELLIHVGLETVGLKGRHFRVCCQSGSRVKRGEVLIEFDLDAVKAEGLRTITPLLVHNSSSYGTFRTAVGKTVTCADVVIELRK